MSHVKSNFNVFVKAVREYNDQEVKSMTAEQFDALPLADQVSIYNHFPDQYDRLTGRAAEECAPGEDNRSHAERFADTFEQRINDAITRTLHVQNGWFDLKNDSKSWCFLIFWV